MRSGAGAARPQGLEVAPEQRSGVGRGHDACFRSSACKAPAGNWGRDRWLRSKSDASTGPVADPDIAPVPELASIKTKTASDGSMNKPCSIGSGEKTCHGSRQPLDTLPSAVQGTHHPAACSTPSVRHLTKDTQGGLRALGGRTLRGLKGRRPAAHRLAAPPAWRSGCLLRIALILR